MSEAHLYALGLALACLSGVRAYLTVLGVGIAGLTGWVELPAALQVTMSPWVLGTAGALTVVEFFADKIPGVDSGWDLLQTLLRVPVGAFLAAATLSGDGQLATNALIERKGPKIGLLTTAGFAPASIAVTRVPAALCGSATPRLMLAGEEAGAGLAAGLALMVRDQGRPPLAGQILIAPMLDPCLATASLRRIEAGTAKCPLASPANTLFSP